MKTVFYCNVSVFAILLCWCHGNGKPPWFASFFALYLPPFMQHFTANGNPIPVGKVKVRMKKAFRRDIICAPVYIADAHTGSHLMHFIYEGRAL